MKFKPGDICIPDVQFSPDCYVILEAFEGDLGSCLVLSTKLRTILLVSGQGIHKIGEVMPALGTIGVQAFLLRKPDLPALDSEEYIRGKTRAQRESAEGIPEDRARWTVLAEAKPGTFLGVHTRRSNDVVTFHYVIERGKKYVFVAANKKGRLHQYPLTSLCLGNQPAAPAS